MAPTLTTFFVGIVFGAGFAVGSLLISAVVALISNGRKTSVLP
jgi:hypothetical protein